MIDIDIDIRRPDVKLRLPAERDSLPVVRQALRSLGEAVDADRELLEDTELAVTEACANAIEHAYGGDSGTVEVTLAPQPKSSLLVTVRDSGRGMPSPLAPRTGGFGLSLIEGIATELTIEPGPDGGTDVAMTFEMGPQPLSLNGHKRPDAAPAERITRRVVAVIAAQTDMPSDRLVESLLVVELATRHSREYLLGEHIQLSLERLEHGFDMRLGPLVADGALALVQQSKLPVVGAVIERLSDRIAVEPEREGERLSLRIGSL
ncbi:MAG: ATP-binding protein [Actinomycetota bacterium]|nr:ATP-binding protein [Actinomycetota bacterium]